MTPNRILVTGGAGFIGSHTVDLLLQQGKQIVVLDNLFSGRIENLNLSNSNLVFIEGDVLELPFLVDLIGDCDAILHLAAISSVPLTIENPIYSFQVNTQGFLHVLEAVKQVNRNMRLVFASSAAVYGEAKTLPCRDDVPIKSNPLSPYALQKNQAEEYAKLYSTMYSMNIIGLRYFNVYGKRQDPQSPYSGVISRFLNAYKNDEVLTIHGEGKQSRDFIHVKDVAIANSMVLHSSYCGVLNIATGVPQTLLQLISHLEAAGQKKAKLNFEAARIGDIQASYADVRTAKTHLGFDSSIPLNEGIQELLQG